MEHDSRNALTSLVIMVSFQERNTRERKKENTVLHVVNNFRFLFQTFSLLLCDLCILIFTLNNPQVIFVIVISKDRRLLNVDARFGIFYKDRIFFTYL